jgi:hypothetical protein
MKIFTFCMECQKELGHPSFEPIILDYYEDSIAYVECNRGHKSALMLQSEKFEILLESAANALIDGYTLEAASTLSSAYERFFEFAIKVLCTKKEVTKEIFLENFKQISKQSERQVGGFLFLYLLEFGSVYKINNKLVEKRNLYIHKGYIPSPEEVFSFGEMIYSEILNITDRLRQNCSSEINSVIHDNLRDRNDTLPSDLPRATTTGTMFFSLNRSDNHKNFSEAFNKYKSHRDMLSQSIPQLNELNDIINSIK